MLSLISTQVLGLTSLTSTFDDIQGPAWTTTWVIEIESWLSLALVMSVTALAGLLLAAFCVALLAQETRDEPIDLRYTVALAFRSWIKLLLMLMGAAVIVLGITSGISMMGVLLSLLSTSLAALVTNVLIMLVVWFAVYVGVLLYFAPQAIVLDDVSIFKAFGGSFRVVRRQLLPTVGFIILVNLIETGLLLVWRGLLSSATTILIAMVGNGYVTTGLVMATLIYYRDRYTRSQTAPTPSVTV
jgi:hypothetical protein